MKLVMISWVWLLAIVGTELTTHSEVLKFKALSQHCKLGEGSAKLHMVLLVHL